MVPDIEREWIAEELQQRPSCGGRTTTIVVALVLAVGLTILLWKAYFT